eukprot:1195198-Prorocentrum_minimum.AAC.8
MCERRSGVGSGYPKGRIPAELVVRRLVRVVGCVSEHQREPNCIDGRGVCSEVEKLRSGNAASSLFSRCQVHGQ